MTKKRKAKVKAKAYDRTTGHTIGDKVNAEKSKAVMRKERGQTRTTMRKKGCNK